MNLDTSSLSVEPLYYLFELLVHGYRIDEDGVCPVSMILDCLSIFHNQAAFDLAIIELIGFLEQSMYLDYSTPYNDLTPLMLAIHLGKFRLTHFILCRSMDINVNYISVKTGHTALMLATLHHRPDLVYIILKYSQTDPYILDRNGLTAFWIAVWDIKTDWDLIEILDSS